MIEATQYQHKTIFVLGLGRSGLAGVASLVKGGGKVLAFDDTPGKCEKAQALGATLPEMEAFDWATVDGLLLSPGIPHHLPQPHPLVAQALDAGVPLLSDFDILYEACPEASYIGITGTNGKSTTTALIYHVLKTAGKPVQMGGNIGQAALTLKPGGAEMIYVLEASSYQLELVRQIHFDVALLLNLREDHLERHGSMQAYIKAKERIFKAPDQQICIIGVDDEDSQTLFKKKAAKPYKTLIPISGGNRVKGGVYGHNSLLSDWTGPEAAEVCSLMGLKKFLGSHNWQNAAAAYAAVKGFGVTGEDFLKACKTFEGLPHRQQEVGSLKGVHFINDSKATNLESAARALMTHQSIYWIGGGRLKEGTLPYLVNYMINVRHAFCIGESTDILVDHLQAQVPSLACHTMAEAVEKAYHKAREENLENPVVLLSPACASFDQYSDFEARGRDFMAQVARLSKTNARVS